MIDIETFFFQPLIYNVEDIPKIRKRIFSSRFRNERRKRRTRRRFINFFTIDIETFFFQLPIYNESKIFQKLENEYFREKKKENKEEGEIY